MNTINWGQPKASRPMNTSDWGLSKASRLILTNSGPISILHLQSPEGRHGSMSIHKCLSLFICALIIVKTKCKNNYQKLSYNYVQTSE